MSNDLTVSSAKTNGEVVEVRQGKDPSQYSMLEHFVKSRMFKDVTSVSQAFVKVQAGKEYGLGPFASMTSLYLVPGQAPQPTAKLIAAKIRESKKYDFRVKEESAKKCVVDFYLKDGNKLGEYLGSGSFDSDQAKKAGTKNMDKYPEDMLFARALMRGARRHCPDLFGGSTLPYTVEEMGHELEMRDDGGFEVVVMDTKTNPVRKLPTRLEKVLQEKGMTAKELADTLQIEEEDLFSAAEEDVDQYESLLSLRK